MTVRIRWLVLVVSTAMVVTAAASAEVNREWVRTEIGKGSGVADLNTRGVGVGTKGGRNRHHAVVWELGKVEPLDLGTFGGDESLGIAINERSQVIGWSQLSNAAVHAFLWQGGRMRDLGTLGGRRSQPAALNERGQVVGDASTKSGAYHAFLWENGRMRDLGTLGGAWSEAVAINERGDVVGTSETTNGRKHGFLWQNGRMRDLGTLGGKDSEAVAINDRGQVVGQAQTRSGVRHAFLWQAGRLQDLGVPAGSRKYQSDAAAINERGQIVGRIMAADYTLDHDMLFLWENGHMVTLGPEAGFWWFGDVSEQGTVVGDTSLFERDNPHAFVWENGHLTDLGRRGQQSSAHVITARGDRIVGWFGNTKVLWTPKPS